MKHQSITQASCKDVPRRPTKRCKMQQFISTGIEVIHTYVPHYSYKKTNTLRCSRPAADKTVPCRNIHPLCKQRPNKPFKPGRRGLAAHHVSLLFPHATSLPYLDVRTRGGQTGQQAERQAVDWTRQMRFLSTPRQPVHPKNPRQSLHKHRR